MALSAGPVLLASALRYLKGFCNSTYSHRRWEQVEMGRLGPLATDWNWGQPMVQLSQKAHIYVLYEA